jgi:hypothetical protein
MKRSLLSASITLAVAICLIGIVPLVNAAAGDSTIFFMTKSAGAVSCLSTTARGRGAISDLGPVQNMHVEVFDLPANTEFTLFVINTPNAPQKPQTSAHQLNGEGCLRASECQQKRPAGSFSRWSLVTAAEQAVEI